MNKESVLRAPLCEQASTQCIIDPPQAAAATHDCAPPNVSSKNGKTHEIFLGPGPSTPRNFYLPSLSFSCFVHWHFCFQAALGLLYLPLFFLYFNGHVCVRTCGAVGPILFPEVLLTQYQNVSRAYAVHSSSTMFARDR